MANRERKNELKIYLSDDEQYILEQKVKISGMKSKSAFLRRQILYGFVYDLDYSDLREYNATRKNQRQSEPDSEAHERNRKCLCYRCKGSQRADEKGMGNAKSHALKTAVSETVIYTESVCWINHCNRQFLSSNDERAQNSTFNKKGIL